MTGWARTTNCDTYSGQEEKYFLVLLFHIKNSQTVNPLYRDFEVTGVFSNKPWTDFTVSAGRKPVTDMYRAVNRWFMETNSCTPFVQLCGQYKLQAIQEMRECGRGWVPSRLAHTSNVSDVRDLPSYPAIVKISHITNAVRPWSEATMRMAIFSIYTVFSSV